MSRIEAGVSDLFGLFRRKGGPPRRDAPADARRSIARPVAGPMFTGAVEEIARIVAQIRGRWKNVRILLRGDSGFARVRSLQPPAEMTACLTPRGG